MSCPHFYPGCGTSGMYCDSCASDLRRAHARRATARASGTSRGGHYRSKTRKASELRRAEAELRAAKTALRKVWKRCGALLEAADADDGRREL